MKEEDNQIMPMENSVNLDSETENVEKYDDYEELPTMEGTSFVNQVSDIQNTMTTGMSMIQNITSVYGHCVELREHRREVEAKTLLSLAKTVAKFKIAEHAMTHIFGERNNALQADYKALDYAISTGNKELIIAAMGKIGDIVTSSPLKEIEELCERFDDPNDSLLDF